ncbi:MAG: sodium:glutamate symporter, partial [Bacteroidales bacterium]|nr:sodium:glutamate symporter [Bacteroidales bacterium]
MINTETFTPWVLLSDLGIIAFLMLIGTLLRAKVTFLQKLLIPASLIAGTLALIFGPNGLGWLPLSNYIGVYPAVLIALVFGALPLSSPKIDIKSTFKRVGPLWAYSQFGMLVQWGVMGIFGFVLFKAVWPELHDAFGVMVPTGFFGGHGTAAAIGNAFAGKGWDEASSLGMTTATVGVVLAIVLGLAFIKHGAKKEMTSYIKDFQQLSPELRSGLIAEENRTEYGKRTTSSISIESLTLHLSFVLIAALGGYLISLGVGKINPALELPVFSCAFIVGLLAKLIFDSTKVSYYIHPTTISSISSLSTDLLVAFGIASIKLNVVMQYALPLVVGMVIGAILVYFTVFFFGKRVIPNPWFEKSIFAWGWWTGTMAMGLALLRIVDPEQRSNAMDDFALAYLPCAPVEILLITFVPA